MFLIPINLDLEANGTVQPVEQKQVFAHVDGEIVDVLVDHGSEVKAGQPLVKLRNRDLEIEITNLQGQLQETNEQILTLGAQIRAQTDRLERVRLQAQLNESKVRKLALEAQLKLQLEKQEQLVRTSPIDGIVMTWDLQKNLRNRPVVTGQILVTVANTNTDWELELLMPEKRMKYLDEAFKDSKGQPLDVEYIMVTDPSVTHKGKLEYSAVHGRAELDQQEGTVVRMRVKPDDATKLSKRTGAEVKADVICGKRSAAFVWFHEVVEWVYANVIF